MTVQVFSCSNLKTEIQHNSYEVPEGWKRGVESPVEMGLLAQEAH